MSLISSWIHGNGTIKAIAIAFPLFLTLTAQEREHILERALWLPHRFDAYLELSDFEKPFFTPRTVGWRARKQQFSRILHLSRLLEGTLGSVVERHAVTSAGNARVRALARSSYFLPKRAVTVWVFTANDFPSVNQLEGMNSLSFGSPIGGHPICSLPELRHYCQI